VVRSNSEESAPLRNWTLNIVKRRVYKVGVVALARKLCGILFAMMRDEQDYQWTKATAAASVALTGKWKELTSEEPTAATV